MLRNRAVEVVEGEDNQAPSRATRFQVISPLPLQRTKRILIGMKVGVLETGVLLNVGGTEKYVRLNCKRPALLPACH